MYDSIFELPTQVLASLNEEDCKVWMDKYNELDPKTEDEAKSAKKEAWKACRELPSSFSFEIIASADSIDKARDIIDLGTIKEHMDSFIDYGGNVQNDHHNYNVGVIWDWKPAKNDEGVDAIMAYGNLFGGDLVYDNMRKNFVNGMNNLSIAGEAAPGKYQCDERGCYTRRNVAQLLEISICDSPMNPYCTMQWYNKDASLTKSESVLSMGVDSYTIHRDSTTCPYLSLKKSLEKIGYTGCHARADGVHVPMSSETFQRDHSKMVVNGICADYDTDTGNARLCRRPQYLERAYKFCYSNGFCKSDGSLTKEIPRKVFTNLYYNLLIEDAGDGAYRFMKK